MTTGKRPARERLLDAAGRLFSERTIHGTKMHDIAQEAGCSRATLHNLFRKKDSIIAALIDRTLDDTVEFLPDYSGNIKKDLLHLVHALYTFLQSHRFYLFLSSDFERNAALKQLFLKKIERHVDRAVILFAAYRETGAWIASIHDASLRDRAFRIATDLLGGLILHLSWRPEEEVDIANLVETFLDGHLSRK